MRRALFITLAGLVFAFTFFYVVAWPSTVETDATRAATRSLSSPPDRADWMALGPIRIVGRKNVTISSVQLNQPSVGIEFVDSRIDVGHGPPTGQGSPDATTLPAAAGMVLHPGDIATIYIAFSAHDPGRYRIGGAVLSYEAGWLTRTRVVGPSIDLTITAT